MGIGALFTERLACSCSQVFGVVGNEVGQVAPLGVVPEMFDRIEFWGIGGQPFDLQPRRWLLLEQADCFTMYTPAIQYDDQRPPQLSMQQAEESDDLFGCNVVVVEAEVTAQTQPREPCSRRPGRSSGRVGPKHTARACLHAAPKSAAAAAATSGPFRRERPS